MSGHVKRLGKVLISIGYVTLRSVADTARRLFRGERPARCTVLYYHAVRADQRAGFERQMERLARRTRALHADHAEPLEAGRDYSVVTFDDAFVCVAEHALPVLAARSIPSTIFVPTGWLGSTPGWSMAAGEPDLDEPIVDQAALRALPGPLVKLGSHTVHHPRMTELTPEQAREEFLESRRQLRDLVDEPIELFAFPYGAWTPALARQALDCGYRRVFTIDPRAALARPDEAIVGRVGVEPDDWSLEFDLKLAGAYAWMPWVSAMKRRLLARPA